MSQSEVPVVAAPNAVDWKISCTDRVVIWIRSARIEEVFVRLSEGRKDPALGPSSPALSRALIERPHLAYLEKMRVWRVPQISLPSDRWAWGTLSSPITNRGFNGRFLTMVGLSDGLSFPLELPMSRTMLREFGKAVTECCRELLVEYGKVPRLSGHVAEAELPPAPVVRSGFPPGVQ